MIKMMCKLVPIDIPSVDISKETINEWLQLLNTRPIPITNKDTILGFTVPGSVIVCGGFLCGSIDGTLCDFELYEWYDVNSQFKNDKVSRFISIEYQRRRKPYEHR